MRVILSVTIVVLTFSWSNCLLEEFLRSDDLDPYAAFVSKVETKLKGNCVTEFPITNWQRRFTVGNTLKDMRKVMCKYDNVDNATNEFLWRSIIEKLDYYDMQAMQFNFELMHLMKKIGKYWTEIDKITKMSDFDTYLGFGCDHLSKYFQWRHNVDAELCNGDINKVYAQFVMTVKDKIKKYESKLNICDFKETLQKELMAFSQQGMKAHIQKYILTSYEVNVTNQCKNSCVNAELEALKDQFLKNVEAYKNLISKTMEEFTAYIKKCDAPKPMTPSFPGYSVNPCGGVNFPYMNPYNKKPPAPPAPPAPPSPAPYIELERAYQVKIVSEKEMDKTGSCSHNCDLSKVSINTGGECQGYTECKFISRKFDVCKAQNSKRRYDWVKDENDMIYGTPSACDNRTKSFSSMVDFWSLSPTSCDYCVCTCVSKPKHDPHTLTAVSFKEQTSDFYNNNNKVVVGLRFVKKDYMLHIQIAEARLLPYGKINASTFSWKPLENFEFNEQEQKFYIKSSSGSMKALSLGKDWGHASSINLDDVMAPKDYIVTGVRFRYAGDNLDCPVLQSGSLELQLQVRSLVFAEGHFFENNYPQWISAGKKDHCELVLYEPDNPMKAPMNSELSASTHFVRFQASDFRKDAGQSTVPFFDGFDVLGTPLVPLKGAGLFHRGAKGFGGFISLKVYDLNSKFYSIANVKKAPAAPAAPAPAGGDNLNELPFFKFVGNVIRTPLKIINNFMENMN
ncbi:GSCOCG00010313001-RA-CDS [Cotesia congregata]|uniref:Uncharacterized protein n=1 Tax=Cotesia congregata TaxID=51543 RepID=A0A8J2EBI9_COTCN|nr:GSCOCG00010313001-RA-CDS [Cotesia congregata]CAG5074858.1 Protein of unknown function [Cotesia congregata]